MLLGEGRAGFLGGAALGLLFALLLIGAGSVFVGQSPSPQSASSEVGGGLSNASLDTNSSATSTSTSTLLQIQAGAAAPPQQQQQQQTTSEASGDASSFGGTSSTTRSGGAFSGPAFGGGFQPSRPSSMLSMLPAEGVSALVGAVAPLLIGLVAAALVYSAYKRRQDASS